MSGGLIERLPGAAVLILGLAFSILARSLPTQTGFGLGPAFLPFWTGVLLSLCGIWLMLRPDATDRIVAPESPGLGRSTAGYLILVCYAAALETLGYSLSTLGFLIGYVWLIYSVSLARAVVVSLAGGLMLILIFRVWLRVPLPGGFLGW